MNASGLPFDDIRDLLGRLPDADRDAEAQVRAVFSKAAARQGSLGRVEEIAAWLAAWSGRPRPMITRPLVAIFAGTHGVSGQSISASPDSDTAQAVELIAAGAAAVSQICMANDLGLKVFDLALHLPSGDITRESALDERGCAATMAFGMEAVAGDTDLLCLSGIGSGSSTAAAALLAATFGGKGDDWIDDGAGAAVDIGERKAAAVDAALLLHRDHLREPLETLRRLGGREFAAIAGAILAARIQKVPVLLDGLTALAVAAVLKAANAGAIDHCLLAAKPTGPAAMRAGELLGLAPLLDFGIDQGQGANGALAAGLVKASALVASGAAEAFGRSGRAPQA